MSTQTVEDVFLCCLSSSCTKNLPAAHVVQAIKAWLTQQKVLPSTISVDEFFAQPDTFGWGSSPEFLLHWLGVVAGKFLKFAASEYAFFHIPANADTMWLTSMTALLIKQEHLKVTFQHQLQSLSTTDASLPWRWSSEVDTVSILHTLLFVSIYYTRPAIAVRVLEPVFLSIVREQEEIFTIVPQLLSYFLPHMSFQGHAFPERIALLADQLAQRGFQFSAGLTFSSPTSTPRVTDVVPMKVSEVLRRIRDVSATTEVRIRSRIEHDDGTLDEDEGLTLNKYLRAVVRVCQQYYVRCKQSSKKQVKNGEMLLKLVPNDVMRVMKELHAMLRFGKGYSDRLQQEGIWKDILKSEGWIPLQVIDEQLAKMKNSILKDLPSRERMQIVELLLRQHDNFQRYQVGYCNIRDSVFHGQRCARSVYGHSLTNPPLYRYIICRPVCLLTPSDQDAIASLPLYGWVALSEKPQHALSAHPSLLCLFDNIPFCVVMPAEAIGAFREYDETTPALKKYDEKLRQEKVYFAEVYLRAIARDGEAVVLDDGGAVLASASSTPSTASRQVEVSSVASELNSVAGSNSSRSRPSTVGGAAPGSTTEVYSHVQDEADSKTQRWYVFPQYYAKRPPKDTQPEGSSPHPSSPDEVDAPRAAIRRRAPKSGSLLGVPKIFFTGRLAELRALRPTERSRHDAAGNGDDNDSDAKTGVRLALKATADGGKKERKELGFEDGEREEGTAEDEDEDDAGGEEKARKELQLDRYRNTPREFDVPVDKSDEGLSGESGGVLAAPLPLCEYVIATSHAPPQLLPPVVVRATLSTAEDDRAKPRRAASAEAQDELTSGCAICLSQREPAAALYNRCFSFSRMQSIFRDYMADPLLKVEEMRADDVGGDPSLEAASLAEWQRATSGSGSPNWERRLGRWGLSPSFIPPPRAGAATPSSPQHNDSGRVVFNSAPLRDALAKFIESDQVACVLEIRVSSEAGEAIDGCRQGIDEVKLFAKEKALTYAKVGRISSRDRREGNASLDSADVGNGSLPVRSGSASPTPAASPSGTSSPPPSRGLANATQKILDLELMEFRKRVSWSVQDLDHTLSELQLSVSDIPYTTLTTALTRECEDRRDNYELLEFIGDAVMDFLVVADACLLSNAAFKSNASAQYGANEDGGENAQREKIQRRSPVLASPYKWTPDAARLPLPRHCWMDSSSALSAVMADTVTAVLCRNHVIAELLPFTVARHFCEEHYPNLAFKVRADVFEAIVGAAYRSGTGLDRLRLLLRRLFSFLPAATRAASAAGSACASELLAALQMCPYLVEDEAFRVEGLLSYRTHQLFELTPALMEASSSGELMQREAGVNTHLVSALLPRIQAKEFATMFTTGSAYAYRRLFAFDTVRVHNRVLHLFSEHSIGFMNEIFTDTIHLVLDIDKVALASWGLLPILWEWYESRYHCPAGMFALDCSGRTMSNKEWKWKDSCHIHFPQVTVSVDTWDNLVTDIRAAVVNALTEKEARLQNTFTAHVQEYRVWLSPKALRKELDAFGGEARPHMWSYCDADALLQLARSCRAVRQSVLEHVAYITHSLDSLARFAELPDAADIFVGDAKEEEEELVVVEHRHTRRRLILPGQWIQPCSLNPPHPVYPPVQTWDDVIDQGLTKSRKLRLYLNDKCDTIYGVEHRPLVLDTLLLFPHTITQDSTVRVSDATQALTTFQRRKKSYVLYRPLRSTRKAREAKDVFFTHRARQDAARHERQLSIRRMRGLRSPGELQQHADAAANSATRAEIAVQPVVWDANEFGQDSLQGWIVECAHRSTLTLSSLRTAEYRGTDAKTYSSWVDCAPLPSPSSSAKETRATAPLLALDGRDDVLPSFNDVFERRAQLPGQLEDFEWVAWFNFFKMRTPDFVLRDDKTPTIRVWSPSWWAFDPRRQVATFYIATEPVLHLANMDSLAKALAPPTQPGGGAGLERVAQLLMPQISTRGKTPVKVKDDLVYILFADKPNSAALPTLNNGPVALQGIEPVPSPISPQPQGKPGLTTSTAASAPSPAEVLPTANLRVTFGAVANVVSLASWIRAAPTAMSEAAWLRHAIHFVFSATVARTELGCVPLVLCETETVFNNVCAAVQQSADEPQSDWLPFVLSLDDAAALERFVNEVSSDSRRLLRHIFVVSSSPAENKPAVPTLTRSALAKNIQSFYRLLTSMIKDSSSVRRYFYVRTDAQRQDIQSALSPSARVI